MNVTISIIYSSIRYNQRPPSLLLPGVLQFRTEQSHKYYFHPKVKNRMFVLNIYVDNIVLCLITIFSNHLWTIMQGARIIKASHFMKRYHLGRKISFVCVATGKPRPQIIWLKDGLELNSYSGYEHEGVSIPGVS